MNFDREELTPQDHHRLHHIHSFALKIEQESADHNFDENSLMKLKTLLSELRFSKNGSLFRLSKIPDHLHPKMTLQHFSNFIVPIERLIDRDIRDDEFLVTTYDRRLALDQAQDRGLELKQEQEQSQEQNRDFPFDSDQTQGLTTPSARLKRRDLYFVLDHIRSAFNVGSIFRLADCVGAKSIFLCGYTPVPEQKGSLKTAMGADQFVKYKSFSKTEQAITELRNSGVYIIGLETSENSKSLFTGTLLGPTAFVVGNERFGLDRKTLELCDEVRNIPMFGIKNSLNVSNSLSIAAFEWSRQNP